MCSRCDGEEPPKIESVDKKQIERALTANCWGHRQDAVEKFAEVMNKKQIERSLTDEDSGVLQIAVEKFASVMNAEQIERLLTNEDDDDILRIAAKKFATEKSVEGMNAEQIVRRLRMIIEAFLGEPLQNG